MDGLPLSSNFTNHSPDTQTQALALARPYSMTGVDFGSLPCSPVSMLGTDQSIKSEELVTPVSTRIASGPSFELLPESNRASLCTSDTNTSESHHVDSNLQPPCSELDWDVSFYSHEHCDLQGMGSSHTYPEQSFDHAALQQQALSSPDDGSLVQYFGQNRMPQMPHALEHHETMATVSSFFEAGVGLPAVCHFNKCDFQGDGSFAFLGSSDHEASSAGRTRKYKRHGRSKYSAKSRQTPCPVPHCEGAYGRLEHLFRHIKGKHKLHEIQDLDFRAKFRRDEPAKCAFRIAFGDRVCLYDTVRPDNRNQHHGSHCKMHIGQPRNAQLDPEIVAQCILQALPCANDACVDRCEPGDDHNVRLLEQRKASFHSFAGQLKPEKHAHAETKAQGQKPKNAHLSHDKLVALGFPHCLDHLFMIRDEVAGKSEKMHLSPSFRYSSFGRDSGPDGCFWVIDACSASSASSASSARLGEGGPGVKRYLCRYRTKQPGSMEEFEA